MHLVKGTVELLILTALSRGRRHGYGISTWIRDSSEGVLGLEDAALYQALHRLEARRLIDSEWGVSDNNRRAKFYQLTEAGEKRLHEAAGDWGRYAQAVFKVLDAM